MNNNMKFYAFVETICNYSDEEVSISVKEINNHMNQRIGVTLDRRTVYAYIEDMKKLGFDISPYNHQTKGYHFLGHKLKEYEIKMLIDAVLANTFITKEKTKELVDKLSKLNSVYKVRDLTNRVFIDDRTKSENEEIFENIDKINFAIKNKKQITFNYYEYDLNKNLVAKLNDKNKVKTYLVTPLGMILKNDNYYLICASKKFDTLSNYRIDRIKNVVVLEDDFIDLSHIKDCENGFNIAVYAKKSFNMFNGVEEEVEVIFNNNLLNTVVSEFRDTVKITDNNDGTFNAVFLGKVGTGLTKWILQFGYEAKVLRPQKLVDDIKDEVSKMREFYKV